MAERNKGGGGPSPSAVVQRSSSSSTSKRSLPKCLPPSVHEGVVIMLFDRAAATSNPMRKRRDGEDGAERSEVGRTGVSLPPLFRDRRARAHLPISGPSIVND
jgi:hypothetical protein